jgi:hypothetical protein
VSDDDPVKPWPVWVRYPIFGLLAACIVYAFFIASWSDASSAGLRVALSLAVLSVVAGLVSSWVRRRRGPVEQQPVGIRDDLHPELVERRLEALSGSVEAVLGETQALRRTLGVDGPDGWAERLDEATSGTSAHEVLVSLLPVLTDLREDPALGPDLTARVDSLRAEIRMLLGMKD